ncbi:MAG: transposase [Nitrospira sp.]|nr:transposase [Nitrospira sp.]
MAKKRVGKFPKAFRQMAVDRLNQCENIVELAKELGISRRLLYTWREKLEPTSSGGSPPANAREATLRKELSHLKRVLAEKVLEVDFFKGALQHVEARRQQSDKTGARASTPRSGQ